MNQITKKDLEFILEWRKSEIRPQTPSKSRRGQSPIKILPETETKRLATAVKTAEVRDETPLSQRSVERLKNK